MPSTTRSCANCGRQIADGDLPGGVCPVCLLSLVLADDSHAAPPLHSLATYRLLTVLSADQAGTVYLAEQIGPERRFVTMEVVAGGGAAEITPAHFEARLKALQQLSVQGIARVIDGWISAAGDCCLVSEYAPGLSLDRYCERHHLDLVERLRFLLAVCLSIEEIHSRNVVHGRLTPDAVVVAVSAAAVSPKVIGLGLCREDASLADDVEGLERVLDAVRRGESWVWLGSGAHGRFASARELRQVIEAVLGQG